MAREETRTSYYNDILKGKTYFDIRFSIQYAVYDYLAQVFFGQDFKRVVYSNPEYAFRKRIENLAKGIDENIFINNLQLPFASFYISSSPKIIKSVSASEWAGYFDKDLEMRLHFAGVQNTVDVQLFFAESDDATVAYTIAQFESHSGAPTRYIEEIYWRNKTLKLPIFITIKEIHAGNESYNESAWLTQNHLFAVTLKLEIESTQVHVNRGLNSVRLPFKWHNTGNVDDWYDGITEYYTQKSVLLFANKSWKVDICPSDHIPKEVKDVAPLITQQDLKSCDERTLKQVASIIPNGATAEMVEGVFREPVRVLFNKLNYNEPKTKITEKGEVLAWIDVVVKPSTYQYWDYTEVFVPSRTGENIIIHNCKDNHVVIDGLHPNSKYTVFFIARDINGNFNTLPLEFTTPVWSKEILPVADDGNPSSLENIQNPTEVPIHGLIGLEL